jgi:hypothetical protein
MILLVLAVLAPFDPGFAALAQDKQDEVVLQWKYQKGETIRYRMSQKVSSDANGTPVRQEIATTMSLEVNEVDATSVVTLVARYEAVAARASGIQEYDYDSEKDKEPPDEPAAKMLSKLVGQSFTMRMGPDGKVLDVRGCEKLVEAMSQGLGENEAAREKARQALRQMFSDEAFKSRMQQLVPPVPQGAVKKGGSWSSDFTIKLPIVGDVAYGIRSTLSDVKDGEARIDQVIQVEFKGGGDRPLAEQIEVKDAKGKSTAVFSIAQGRFLSQKASVEMTLIAPRSRIPVRVETELKLLEKK